MRTQAVMDRTQAAKNFGSNSGTQDYITPVWILDVVREVFDGDIDLDVASSAQANTVVKAKRYFTAEDDALSTGVQWKGNNVWMNPPFPAKGSPKNWMLWWLSKFIWEYLNGRIQCGMIITYAQMNTKWGQLLGQYPRWHPAKRVDYILPSTMEGDRGVMKGSMITYIGPDPMRFATVCTAAGGTVDFPFTYLSRFVDATP